MAKILKTNKNGGVAPAELTASHRFPLVLTSWRTAGPICGLLFGLLSGCGGGDGTATPVGPVTQLTAGDLPLAADGSPVTVVTSTAVPVPDYVTMAQYKALRSTVVSVTGGETPSAQELAVLRMANYKTAVDQIAPDLKPGSNALVVPPLTDAIVRTLAAAASGDTLAQIQANFDVAPTPYLAALQTSAVASQFWADKTRLFRTGFLAATDSLGPFARLSDWAGSETGFASGDFETDPALAASFTKLFSGLSTGHLPTPTKELRLVAAHQVTAKAPWGAVTPFDGVFDRGLTSHDLLRMPMVRVSAGVKRIAGSDFTADVLPMPGGRHLISLRPASGTLADFATTRLPLAFAEAVQRALAEGGTTSAGELVLPLQALSVNFDAKAPLGNRGVTLPFDEVNANLRNLDGAGGVFANRVLSTAMMAVGADGFSMTATDVTAFTFSPKNIHFSGYGGSALFQDSGSYGMASFDLFTCTWPTPNLRTFYLAVVDANRWVVSLAAIQGPTGTPVGPEKTAYNPWPNDPRWNINAAIRGSIPATPTQNSYGFISIAEAVTFTPAPPATYTVETGVFLLGDAGEPPQSPPTQFIVAEPTPPPPPLPPPPPPAPTHWDVVAEAAQYGFVRVSRDSFVHSSCDNR